MAIEQVTMFKDSGGECHPSRVKAEQAEAWLQLLKAFEYDTDCVDADTEQFLNKLYDRRDAVRAYLDANDAVWEEINKVVGRG